MGRIMIITSCFVLISATAFSQSKTSRQNSLVFSAGAALRVTPFRLGNLQPGSDAFPFMVQSDAVISGPAVYAGIMHYWGKPRISFEYANSFRYHYSYLNYGEKAGYRLTSDFHF